MAGEAREELAKSREADEAAAHAAAENLPRAVSFIVERIEKQ